MLKLLRRAIIGKPMESARLIHERYSTFKGLAILSSDPYRLSHTPARKF